MLQSSLLIIVILIFSLLGNLLVLFFDTFPFLKRRYKNKFKRHIINKNLSEEIIVNKSLLMAKSKKVAMIWEEPKSLTEEILNLRNYRFKNLFKKYNYPRAFLISGLTDYAKSKQDANLMLEIVEIFDFYINKEGLPNFKYDKVDQTPFGLAAINLYQFTNDIRYKKFAEFIYTRLLSAVEKDTGIILYRKNSKVQFNDILGMICPFILRYEEIINTNQSSNLVKTQLQYFINYGMDKETYLPTHGINLRTNIKIGPTNWGRGIGWFIIALASYVKRSGTYSEELEGLINTLNKLKNDESLWTQFPGLSSRFDASSTTMFMYSINLIHPGTFSRKQILSMLGKYITKEGLITSTSGDTYHINKYSNSFGDSELSQGMLLMLLSTTYNN